MQALLHLTVRRPSGLPSSGLPRVAAAVSAMRNGVGNKGSVPPVILTSLARSWDQPAMGMRVRKASFGVDCVIAYISPYRLCHALIEAGRSFLPWMGRIITQTAEELLDNNRDAALTYGGLTLDYSASNVCQESVSP